MPVEVHNYTQSTYPGIDANVNGKRGFILKPSCVYSSESIQAAAAAVVFVGVICIQKLWLLLLTVVM